MMKKTKRKMNTKMKKTNNSKMMTKKMKKKENKDYNTNNKKVMTEKMKMMMTKNDNTTGNKMTKTMQVENTKHSRKKMTEKYDDNHTMD